jgi:hypothetical protein
MSNAANNQSYANPGWGPGPGPNRPWGNPYWQHAHFQHWAWNARPFLIVAMILGFCFWWPVGLALLALFIWSRKMAGCGRYSRGGDFWGGWKSWGGPFGGAPRSSGNSAFDEYRAETLRRLEDEQKEFQEYLDRLRAAKDRSEFDQFMNDRRSRPSEPPPQPAA